MLPSYVQPDRHHRSPTRESSGGQGFGDRDPRKVDRRRDVGPVTHDTSGRHTDPSDVVLPVVPVVTLVDTVGLPDGRPRHDTEGLSTHRRGVYVLFGTGFEVV